MIGYVIGGLVLILLTVVVVRTIGFKRTVEPTLQWQKLDINGDRIAKKMSEAIKIATVSYMDRDKIDYSAFRAFQEMLIDKFPLVHKETERTVISDYSLVYRYRGKDAKKKPVLFMSHIDVVPIADGTERDWTYPPFSGAIEEGYVWGRGAIDTKVTLVSALEAAELLIEKGYEPDRDIYFAFGHDEEIQGKDGAQKLVKWFADQDVHFDFVLDEGGIVTTDSLSDVAEPLAIIGVSEKGYVDIEVTVKGNGGHASMPPKSTALGQLSQALINLEKHQMPMRLSKPVEEFLLKAGPSMTLVNRIVLANLWLLKPVFMKIFSGTNTGNALLRTTTAVTMAQASNASNVLPQIAKGTVNFRIAPGDTIASVEQHIKDVNRNIPIETSVIQGNEPSGISSTESEAFANIAQVATHVFGDVITAPYMVMAATDSRYYEPIADNVYRFAPLMVNSKELASIHNTNERISIDNLIKSVSFYMHLMMEV